MGARTMKRIVGPTQMESRNRRRHAIRDAKRYWPSPRRIAAKQCMRGTGRQSQPPGDETPGHRADKSGENNERRYGVERDKAAAHKARHAGAEHEERGEIEEGRHEHRMYRF